jgi:CubicO group peptidase (beta-lactamase class C family)
VRAAPANTPYRAGRGRINRVTVRRRTLLWAAGAGLAGVGLAGAGMSACAGRGGAARRALGAGSGGSASPSTGSSGAAAAPIARTATTPADLVFTPGRTVRAAATPAGYAERLLAAARRYQSPTPDNPQHATHPGAVVLVAVDGEITVHAATGDAVRYGAGPVELPPGRRVAMRPDSIFDLASITKVFTALLVLRQMDRGAVDPAAPVASYLPDFAAGQPAKARVTVEMLLAHTGGVPVGLSLAGAGTPAARRAKVLSTPLIPGAVPGATFRYSSLGLLVLGQLVERVTGRDLGTLMRTELIAPLGLRETGFRPLDWLGPADRDARLVATDARSSRGLLRGVVHDQVAHAFDGVAAHAGLFSTATDLAVVGQMLINGGEYNGTRLLGEATVRRMLTNVNGGKPAVDADRPGRSATHGLGVELDQPWFMGRLAGPLTFGHTGFTGTSLLVDPNRRLVLVLLTNRAHPNWSWGNPDKPRVAVADALAGAVG